MTLRETEAALLAGAVFTVEVENLLVKEVVETAANSVVLWISMIKLRFRFSLFGRWHDVNLSLILGPGALAHKILHFGLEQLIPDPHLDIILLHEVEENTLTSNSPMSRLPGNMLFWRRIFLTNPQPDDTGVIGENVDSHVDEGAVYETDDRSAG